MYYVYVLYSLRDHGMYIGQTGRLIQRVKQHQLGKVKSTMSRRPLVLIYWEEVVSREEALEREGEWKTCSGRRGLRKKLESRLL